MRDLSHTNSYTSTKKSRRFFSTSALNLGLLVTILVCGLVYVYTVNSIATNGLAIKKMATQIAGLEDEQKNLELQNSTLQSVTTIQKESQQLNLVPVTTISYVKDDNFALK